jgi:DNA polymerase III subunit epsilon
MSMNDMLQFFRNMSGKLGSNIYAGVQGQNNPNHISFLRQLQKELKQNNSLEIPLKNLPVVIFDLETTGFHPEKGAVVISVGAIKMVGSKILKDEVFYSLVKTDTPIPNEISTLTNIYNKDLHDAPEARGMLIDFFSFIGSNLLVAHHAKHELAFMQKLTHNQLSSKFEHRIVDTSFFISLMNPLLKSQSLEETCYRCGIEVTNRHHALEDAKMTAAIWSLIVQSALDKGIVSLREIYEYLAKQR